MFSAIGRRWSEINLASRLTMVSAVLLVVAMTAVGFITIAALRAYLTDQMDRQITTAARVLTPIVVKAEDADPAKYFPVDYYILVDMQDGRALEAIAPTTLQEAGKPDPAYLPRLGKTELSTTSLMQDKVTIPSTVPGQTWRIVSVITKHKGKENGIATIGIATLSYETTIQSVAYTILLTGIIVVVVGSMMTNYLFSVAFRQLRKIESVAGKIAGGDLTQRVPQAPPSTEVGSLSQSLNRMLAHLESAFSARDVTERKMRRFISDSSHELRTPTAAIRGYAELYRMGGVPPERQAEVMERIESEARRMGNLVEDLLALARLDERRPLNPTLCDVTEIARACLSDMVVLDSTRPTALVDLNKDRSRVLEPRPTQAIVDRDKISQLFTNLLSNVLQHTPSGTAVEIAIGYGRWPDVEGGEVLTLGGREAGRLAPHNRCVVCEVRDHGPGISEQDAERVFERFYRADVSRSRASGGSGLGLAIVSGVVSAHGGQVQMGHTPGGGVTVQVVLPCQGPAASADND